MAVMTTWGEMTPGERHVLLWALHRKHNLPFPFSGRPSLAGLAVRHIDGDPTNNDPDNLRVVDPTENVRHR